MLTGGEATVKQTEAGIEITVPKSDRQEIDTIVALELDKPAIDIAPIAVGSLGQSLAEGKKATASNVYQKNNHYAAAMAVDGDEETRWATDASTGPCWLEVDLGKPETFDRALIDECVELGVRVKAFELQSKDGDEWKTFHSGKAIGKQLRSEVRSGHRPLRPPEHHRRPRRPDDLRVPVVRPGRSQDLAVRRIRFRFHRDPTRSAGRGRLPACQ